MYTDIRKISVGLNFPNKAMHFVVGNTIVFNDVNYTIHSILEHPTSNSNSVFLITISDGTNSVLWKSISGSMPIVIEYNIDFS